MQKNLPTKLVPLKWVIKFDPPQIGLVYKLNEKDKKKRLYIIELNDLVTIPNPVKVAHRLFLEHPLYLNKAVVQLDQVAKLVEIIQEQLHLAHDQHYQFGNEEYDENEEQEENEEHQGHQQLDGKNSELHESDFNDNPPFDDIDVDDSGHH